MQSNQAITLGTLGRVECFVNANRRSMVSISRSAHRKIFDDVIGNFNADAFN